MFFLRDVLPFGDLGVNPCNSWDFSRRIATPERISAFYSWVSGFTLGVRRMRIRFEQSKRMELIGGAGLSLAAQVLQGHTTLAKDLTRQFPKRSNGLPTGHVALDVDVTPLDNSKTKAEAAQDRDPGTALRRRWCGFQRTADHVPVRAKLPSFRTAGAVAQAFQPTCPNLP